MQRDIPFWNSFRIQFKYVQNFRAAATVAFPAPQ